MTDPFAAALAALFRAPGSTAAAYTAAGAAAKPIRVILGQPSDEIRMGRGRSVKGSTSIEIQRADVAEPATGDRVDLVGTALPDGTTALKLYGEPRLDAEGLTWVCGAVPA